MKTGEEARETDLGAVATKAFEAFIPEDEEDKATKPRPALADTLCVMYDVSKECLYFLIGTQVEKINTYANYYWKEKH